MSGGLESEADKVQDAAEKVAQSVRNFQVFPLPDEWKDDLKSLLTDLEDAVEHSKSQISASFNEWREQNNIAIEPVDPSAVTLVLDSYFKGCHPFRSRRSRKDFPDGFIWAAILKICHKPGLAGFVTGDDFFRSNLSGIPSNLKFFSSIESLLEESNLGEMLKEGILDSQLERVAEFCRRVQPFGAEMEEEIARVIKGRRVSVFFPVESVASIDSVERVTGILLGRRPLTYYGDGLISLPFSACAICILNIEVPEEAVPPKRREKFSSIRTPKNGIFSGSLQRTLVLEGAILGALNPKLLEKESTKEDITKELKSAEWVLELVSVWWEVGSKDRVSNTAWEEQVRRELNRQLQAHDLSVDIDPEEEEDRLGRARWVNVPEEFHGTHGDITITPEARVQIAPMPRFENWVHMLKRLILDKESPSE